MRINPLQLPDPAVGRQLRHYPHTSPIDTVAWSTDGQGLVSSEWDGGVKKWDPLGDAPALDLDLHKERVRMGPVAVSPDGKWIAGADDEAAVTIWDAVSGDALFCFRHTQEQRPETVHPDGSISYPGAWYSVLDIRFSEDGGRLVTAGGDGHARVWKFEESRGVTLEQSQELGGLVGSAALVGDTLLTQSGDGVRAFGADGQQKYHLAAERGFGSLETSDRGLAAAVLDREVVVFEAATGKTVAHQAFKANHMAFAPGSDELFVAAPIDNTVTRWNFTTGQQKSFQLPKGDVRREITGVRDLAFSPDGQRLAVAMMDYSLKILATRQGLEDVLGESSGPPLQLELDDEWLMIGDSSVEVNQF
ncbi:MAG: WD40 repeat domain-containing protein [Vulcanimicrobiota bacterium]